MIPFKKALVLLLISNVVGDIISSSSSSSLVSADVPNVPKATPRKSLKKQCHGNCDCARYSHYDVPKDLRSGYESQERPPVPERRNPLPKTPDQTTIKSISKNKKDGLVENPIYASIHPTKSKSTFKTHSDDGPFYTSYGRPVENDYYDLNVYDEPIYEEIKPSDFTKEHTPSGYSEHIYAEPYQLPAPPKTKYQKFKDNASDKFASLKKCAKSAFVCQSKNPKDSSKKAKKGVTDVTSNLTKKPVVSKKVSAESAKETKNKINKATKELLMEADKLASKLNEGTRPRFYDVKESTSRPVKGSKHKMKRGLKKTEIGFSDIGRDLRGEAKYVGKGAKAKLQGAKHKVTGELDRLRKDARKSAFKGKDSVSGYIADQLGDFGNARPKTTMEKFK